MNDNSQEIKETQELQRSLEWATASTAAPESGMDPQTAALREAWTARGRLLETAETPMDPLLIRRPDPRLAARRWLPVGAGLAAALVAIVCATVWIALAARRADTSPPESQVVVQPSRLQSGAGETPAPQDVANLKSGPSGSTSASPEAAWDDTVDDEIAQVGKNLIGVQQDWHACAGALDLVWCQLERIQAEVETGQL